MALALQSFILDASPITTGIRLPSFVLDNSQIAQGIRLPLFTFTEASSSTLNFMPSGGVIVTGAASIVNDPLILIASCGVKVGGSADVVHNIITHFAYTALGGIKSGGGATISFDFTQFDASSGVKLSGAAVIDSFHAPQTYDLSAESSGVFADNALAGYTYFVVASSQMEMVTIALSPRVFEALASSEMSGQSIADVIKYISASVSSGLSASSSASAQASYHLLAESIATIIDGIQYVNDYFDGWAYNLNNEAPSFYENFKFNSFAKLGQNYYGMSGDGIHLLSGDNDNGVDINSLIKTGMDNFDDPTLKTIPTIYASARSSKEIILNAKVDEHPDYDYSFIGKPGEIAPIRVKLGRGLKGLNWAIEIRNKDGAFIEIDQLEIPSVSTSRKV